MKTKLAFVVLGVVAVGVIGYFLNLRPTNVGPINDKLQVTTSFYPLYFFASEIAGDKAVVYNITPAGAEPHDYEPTPQDVARMEDSKLLILNGGKFEAWGDKMKDNLKNKPTIIVAVGEALINQDVVEDGEVVRDPHVWLSPVLVKKEVAAIVQGFVQADPENASYYETNAEKLGKKLDGLHAEFRQGLSSCQKKDIITSHAAFGYLAREYNLNQVAISGLSPDEDPSPQKLREAADFARKNQVKYIFFESLVSPKLSETIAYEVGAQTLVLNPIEGLSDDEINQGKDYFTEMRNNLTNLKIALECR